MSTAIQARLSTLVEAFRNKQLDLNGLRARLIELCNLAGRQGGGDLVEQLTDINDRLADIADGDGDQHDAALDVLDELDGE